MIQQEALHILKSGANVFLNGEPGSGKTYTINCFVKYLREHNIEPAITASTGIAATHINGMTIHSWSGIGINRVISEDDLEVLSTRKRLISRLTKTRILIIDEISMIDAQTLDLVETVCRKLKNNSLPWGGLQVIFVGDFFQLPPISPKGEEPRKFAYMSMAWQAANPTVCYLCEQYRQDDEQFLSLLASIRKGDVADKNKIKSILKIKETDKNHTRLYSHNINVDRVNDEKLNALNGKEREFIMESRGPENFVQQLKRGCLSPETLRLKIGAKVMFTKNNFKEGFANGTMGIIEKFSEDGLPIARTERGRLIEVSQMEWSIIDGTKTLARIFQIPLRLAWAITIHKSQGMTLDSAVIDLSESFEYGQGYVALSRVRTLDGLHLVGYNEKSLEVHPDVLEIDEQFKKQSSLTREKISKISVIEKEKIEKDFIIACGGKCLGKIKKSEYIREEKILHSAIKKESTYDKTLILWKQGKTIEDIAADRRLVYGTIFSHLEELFMRNKIEAKEFQRLASPRLLRGLPKINSAFKEFGIEKLTPVFEKFKGIYSYDDLRLARILLSDTDKK